MIFSDLHVHSSFCDGKNPPEEIVKAAINRGLKRIGIVAHSYVPFDAESCIPLSRIEEFQSEIKRLREKYSGSIDVLCGVEADIFSTDGIDGFDYIIGSVHYLKRGDRFISVDESPEITKMMINQYYGGDFYAMAKDYFDTVSLWAERRCDIIGHFDLVKKFKKSVPFDDTSPRYISAWQSAADRLLKLNVPFEINLGGINRGYLDEPYPSRKILEYIKNRGGNFVLSSDAHDLESIALGFENYQDM